MLTQIQPAEATGKTIRLFLAEGDWRSHHYQVIVFTDDTYVALNGGRPSEPFHPFKIGKKWSAYIGLCTHAEYQALERESAANAAARLKECRRESWVELCKEFGTTPEASA